jgi:FMN phosphatase YigB (HAD superfamily)
MSIYDTLTTVQKKGKRKKMNIFHKILVVTSIFCSTALPIEQLLTPENTIFSFDIDDVVIEKSFWHKSKLVIGGMLQNIFSAPDYIRALINVKNSYKRNSSGIKEALSDVHGNPINGLTFHFLYHGMRDSRLTPYVAWIIETMEHSRCFIDDTKKIIEYLKAQGYTIVFATNKDRVSYDITAQAFGNEFTNIPTKVFVAHPGNNNAIITQLKEFAELPTTPVSYKKLEYKARTVQPTATIFHAPSTKPALPYFQYMEKTVGADKNIIFIDDKKENVNGFNKLQETTTALRRGIHFKNPIQLAKELIELGILSEINDKKLLDEIEYPEKKGRFMRPIFG